MSPAPDRDAATARANAEAAAEIVRALVDGGVRAAVMSPGSRNTPLVLALAAHPAIALWPALDERAAAFFALGLARASGRPVALACTSGSAGAHWLPAVVEAAHSAVPLVLLTADRPPELHGCGAPQTVAQERLFGDFVGFARALPPPRPGGDPRFVRAVVADAVSRALGPPMGPVHLDVPFREPLWLPGVEAAAGPSGPPTVHHRAPRAPGRAAVAAARARIAEARRGVIVCGPDAAPDARAARAIADLGARLGWPVLAEAASGVRFGDGPVVATYDALLRGPLGALEPDCVLRFGLSATSKPLARWLSRVGGGRTLLVDPGGRRHDPDRVADALFEADPGAFAEALDGPRADAAWTARWLGAEEVARHALRAACADGFWSGAVAAALVDALPADGALHAGNSMPVRDVDAFALPRRGRALRVLVSRGANGIDGTIATAAGEALARAPRPMALMLGDLAAVHDAGGLLLAGQLFRRDPPAPLAVVVLDNGGGGIFEHLPIAAHPTQFERLFLTPQAVDLGALCAAAGVGYRAVDDRGALDAALGAALGRPGLTLIHARVDRTLDLDRHRAAWRAVAEALAPEAGR